LLNWVRFLFKLRSLKQGHHGFSRYFRVWDPANQLRNDLSLSLPYDSLKIVECEMDKHVCVFSDFTSPLQLMGVPQFVFF
jgi:hypothetical protein